jgi:hypothetical protein
VLSIFFFVSELRIMKKVPVTVFVDPEAGAEFTIKPFAAGLAITPGPVHGVSLPDEATNTASFTNTNGQYDSDMDLDG